MNLKLVSILLQCNEIRNMQLKGFCNYKNSIYRVNIKISSMNKNFRRKFMLIKGTLSLFIGR